MSAYPQTVPTRRPGGGAGAGTATGTWAGGGSLYKLSGPGGPEAGPGPDYVACFLSFSVVSICADRTSLSDQAQVTLQMSVSLLDLV